MRQETRGEQGRRAERLVTEWLVTQGAQVVATNLRLGHLEIDIVARKGQLVMVVEVRSRAGSSYTSGFSSVSPLKKMRIKKAAARLWDRRYKNDASVERVRIDVASVSFWTEPPSIEYVEAAF